MVEEQTKKEQKVDAFNVEAETDEGVDYEKLVRDWGCDNTTPELVERLEKCSGQRAHRFIRRGIFFCHRDLDTCLEAYENKKPFYLYTGRGPSNESLHMGHCVPMIFTKYLQDAFDVPLVI